MVRVGAAQTDPGFLDGVARLYDLEIDTSALGPRACALRVRETLRTRGAGTALHDLPDSAALAARARAAPGAW